MNERSYFIVLRPNIFKRNGLFVPVKRLESQSRSNFKIYSETLAFSWILKFQWKVIP